MTQPTSTLPPTAGTGWTPPGWAPPTIPPPPAPPAKRKIGRYIVGGVVLLFIVAGLAGSGDKKDARSSDGVAVATTATTGTTSVRPATVSSVSAWAVRYGADDADVLESDLNALAADAGAEDVLGMSASCRTFQRHLATAESHLPTPDAQLTSALSEAYGYFNQTAAACINGIATMDSDELSKMAAYLPLGTASLREATARVNSFR